MVSTESHTCMCLKYASNKKRGSELTAERRTRGTGCNKDAAEHSGGPFRNTNGENEMKAYHTCLLESESAAGGFSTECLFSSH